MRFFDQWSKRSSGSPVFQTPVIVHQVDSGVQGASPVPMEGTGFPLRRQLAMAILALGLSVGAGTVANWQMLHQPGAHPLGGMAEKWQVANEASLNGMRLFRVDQGGPIAAGTRSTLILTLFQEALPPSASRIDVTATYWLGGKPLVLAQNLNLADATFTTRYDEIQAARIGVPLGVPKAGLWRLDVKVDGREYGHVVLDVPDFPWVVSVRKPLVEQDGWLGRTIALEGPTFVAGKSSDYTWYLLGRGGMTGPFRVEALRRGATTGQTLFESGQLGPPKYGATASVSTKLKLPSPGIWRITAYVGGLAFGSFVVEAQ